MLKYIKHPLFLSVVCAAFLSGCAATSDNPAEKYAKVPEKKLFQQAVLDISSRHYNDSIEKFEALDARYPFGEYAEKGQLYIIYSYYQSEQFPEGRLASARFIHMHPESAHSDYAYFMQGLLNYQQNLGVFDKYFTVDLASRDLSAARHSFVDFTVLVNDYPNSMYRDPALEYMTYWRNLMADQEQQVAQFYFERKAYLAALEHANYVIVHYQGAPAVSAAVSLARQAYAQLGLQDLASRYQRVWDANFSTTATLH